MIRFDETLTSAPLPQLLLCQKRSKGGFFLHMTLITAVQPSVTSSQPLATTGQPLATIVLGFGAFLHPSLQHEVHNLSAWRVKKLKIRLISPLALPIFPLPMPRERFFFLLFASLRFFVATPRRGEEEKEEALRVLGFESCVLSFGLPLANSLSYIFFFLQLFLFLFLSPTARLALTTVAATTTVSSVQQAEKSCRDGVKCNRDDARCNRDGIKCNRDGARQ